MVYFWIFSEENSGIFFWKLLEIYWRQLRDLWLMWYVRWWSEFFINVLSVSYKVFLSRDTGPLFLQVGVLLIRYNCDVKNIYFSNSEILSRFSSLWLLILEQENILWITKYIKFLCFFIFSWTTNDSSVSEFWFTYLLQATANFRTIIWLCYTLPVIICSIEKFTLVEWLWHIEC